MATFKRKVFYLGGFDPRGVRFYHALYRDAAERWSARTGEALSVGPRRRADTHQTDWTVTNETQDVETSYSFLRWEDIVQRAWIKSPLALAVRGARTYWGLWRTLDRPLLRTLPRGPIITMVFPPIAFLLLPLLIALVPFLLALIWLPWWLALPIGLAIGIGLAGPLLKRAHAPWLLRFFIFNGELVSPGDMPALDERLALFAERIAAELDGDWDEILLVSHSNGSILAMPVLAELLAQRGGDLPDNFTLVTLGHCIPLVAVRNDATRFRERLSAVAAGHFHWLDIGSPPDGAAFWGINPMKGVRSDYVPWLEQLSPRFHLFYDPETYHKGWANKYEIHFDYLRVGDRISPLDYPSITATRRPIDESVDLFRQIP